MSTTQFIISIVITAVFVGSICYLFWYMFLKGEKMQVVVDDYVHPDDAKKNREGRTEIIWCIRFTASERHGKPEYIYSKRHYNTRQQAAADYPKKTKVNIKRYQTLGDRSGKYYTVIMDDNKDKKQALYYTFLMILAGAAILTGNYLLNR